MYRNSPDEHPSCAASGAYGSLMFPRGAMQHGMREIFPGEISQTLSKLLPQQMLPRQVCQCVFLTCWPLFRALAVASQVKWCRIGCLCFQGSGACVHWLKLKHPSVSEQGNVWWHVAQCQPPPKALYGWVRSPIHSSPPWQGLGWGRCRSPSVHAAKCSCKMLK